MGHDSRGGDQLKYTPYAISESKDWFLVLHIGVGLERHYNIGYQRQPRVLLSAIPTMQWCG